MFWVKLRAGALQLTLFIIVVIALLLAAFVLLINTHKRFQIQTDFIIETTRNADKGIDYALQNTIRLNDTTSINLEDEDYKNLKVHRDFWGVFEKITTVSQIKNNRFQKIALIGAKQSEGNRSALYLQDNNMPLVLVGNTKIEGTAYLPKRGVKSGNISGESYYGSKLIYGQTKVASKLPKVFAETIDQIKLIENLVSKVLNQQFISLESGNQYSNSFLKPTQVVFSNSDIYLNEIKLTGNIIIQSKTKIIVEASSILKDVVLIAPKIEIKNNVIGNFQAIASKNILVGKSVQLQYPSALVLNENKILAQQEISNESIEQNNIIINDNSTIKGLVLFLGLDQLNNYKAQVKLKEKATIIGELYCNTNTELEGTINGTVYSNNFIANQAGSIYQNHIYNGEININELSEEYVGLPFKNSKKGVLKWLY
jgi:cytoskeletal protein CcmA (bactofilin family)